MKKIPTLFERIYENHKVVGINDNVTSGMEWVLEGKGLATVKWDGSCCAVMSGELYRRYDAKKGKKPPEGAIPCGDPDPVTGHWPHWVKCSTENAADKWYVQAYRNTVANWTQKLDGSNPPPLQDGTYEAVGPHFQGNPYKLEKDILIPHGTHVIVVERTFSGIRDYLQSHPEIEGIVFWRAGAPLCKIKRTDFGFRWPVAGYIVEEEPNENQT